jgi:hypothetical protein
VTGRALVIVDCSAAFCLFDGKHAVKDRYFRSLRRAIADNKRKRTMEGTSCLDMAGCYFCRIKSFKIMGSVL